MIKLLSTCSECGENNSILTQVSSGPEITLLCSDCYRLKYTEEVQKKIIYVEEEKN